MCTICSKWTYPNDFRVKITKSVKRSKDVIRFLPPRGLSSSGPSFLIPKFLKMVDVDKMSDAELRTKLLEFGFPVMPITGTTRKVMTKKLKLLLENKNKIGSDGGRRSLGRYSSEEESDTEVKVTKKRDNRRATMAAPVMQPPANTTRNRKSARFIETEVEPSHSPPRRDTKTTSSSTTTRTHKIIKSAQDEFDTGSDSESDIVTNNYNSGNDFDYKRSSPIKPAVSSFSSSTNRYSAPQPLDASYSSARSSSFTSASPSRLTSYNSPSLASEYASDRLNQIRSRLTLGSPGYDRPVYSPTSITREKEETPFLSNFTKRLSALTAQKKDDEYNNDIIKEHDTNGSGGYVRSQLSRAARGRDTTYDYKSNQNSILKNNFVSFAVLAGAALFFIFLAIMYLGIRSDTSVIPAGINIPRCETSDITKKKGINCVFEDDVITAIHLLNVVKPELQKRAVANKCFDMALKPHMTESEIINFCMTNFAIKDEHQIISDLKNLEILTFTNPDWKISVVQAENNNGLVSEADVVQNMEQVIFNHEAKITSLVMLNPDLPWKCKFYNTFYLAFNSLLVVGLLFGAVYVLNLGYKYYHYYEQKQKDEIGFMVEKIIDILQTSASEDGSESFVVINHVRDMILPLKDRKGKQKMWAKAVKYISENESRVRTEIQEVQGEPFEVWRWIGSANLSMTGNQSDYVYRQGRRIVDVQYLIKEVLKFPHKRLYFCSSKDVEIKNEVRDGLLSVLLLRCKRCNKEHTVCSEDPASDLMNVNLAFVAGVVSLGLSLYHLNEICSSLQIAGILAEEYNRYLDEIFEIYNDSLTDNEKSKQKSFQEELMKTSTPKLNTTSDFDVRKQEFLKNLEKTPGEIERISKLTAEQSNSPLWYEERKIRLTASNFGRIFKLLDKTDRNIIVNDLLHSNFTGNTFTKYGNDNEINAIKDFEKVLGQCVISCGLFIHQDYPFLAASPDGLIGEDALVEVKCPYKAKDLTPEEAIATQQIQYATFENRKLSLKRSDRYYYQVQGQLFVTRREFCYFVVWSPKGLVYEKIGKDQECWDKMFPKLEEFYFGHLLPALLKEK
ncbi:hypothetical protein NQ315_013639 [Exocentrus adspersus]|uniref:LEM domain-containing protein n=1 Tax=Exocentrus adspersus TaxID=1586481 RepID=A0AAV8W3B9_9CUCU|nr:hypothetical protein NQ315_013639 [Exocentrus adspersus]